VDAPASKQDPCSFLSPADPDRDRCRAGACNPGANQSTSHTHRPNERSCISWDLSRDHYEGLAYLVTKRSKATASGVRGDRTHMLPTTHVEYDLAFASGYKLVRSTGDRSGGRRSRSQDAGKQHTGNYSHPRALSPHRGRSIPGNVRTSGNEYRSTDSARCANHKAFLNTYREMTHSVGESDLSM
jgi:hypothetical protein